MNIFSNFSSEKPAINVLPVGDHAVVVDRIFEIDSFTNFNGSAKEDSEWSEATPQLGISFKNDSGVISTRLNGLGYKHSEDFSPEDLKDAGLVDVDGYACTPFENGKYQRIPDEARTTACRNILNRFMHACQIPEGSGLNAIVPGLELIITVKSSEWDGKTHNEVSGFKVLQEQAATLELQ